MFLPLLGVAIPGAAPLVAVKGAVATGKVKIPLDAATAITNAVFESIDNTKKIIDSNQTHV